MKTSGCIAVIKVFIMAKNKFQEKMLILKSLEIVELITIMFCCTTTTKTFGFCQEQLFDNRSNARGGS